MKNILSLNIICQNNEKEIKAQMVACKDYFDIIRYCDGGSQDKTKDIITSYSGGIFKQTISKIFNSIPRVEYYYRKWDDNYHEQDNVLLSKASPGEWMMIMDSDEIPSVPLLNNLRMLSEFCEENKYDMVSIPCLLSLDGELEHEINEFIFKVKNNIIKPFRKLWFFKYSKDLKSFGTPHRDIKRKKFSKTLKTKSQAEEMYGHKFSTYKTEYPYIHYKTRYSFLINDIFHGWIYPKGQGYTELEGKEMVEALSETLPDEEVPFWSSLRLKYFLEKEFTELYKQRILSNEKIPIVEFARKYKSSDKPIKSWWSYFNMKVDGELDNE